MKHYFLDDLQALKMVINTSKFSHLAENFEKAAQISVNCLKNGNTILICGNGGSASDAEHMAGEIVGRFGYDRPSLPCISLCTPSATFTAISNDYGYEKVFARQVSGFGKKGDVLIGISTSGNSANIVEAFKVAKTFQNDDESRLQRAREEEMRNNQILMRDYDQPKNDDNANNDSKNEPQLHSQHQNMNEQTSVHESVTDSFSHTLPVSPSSQTHSG